MKNVLKKILLPLFLLSTAISVGFSAWNIDDPKFDFPVTNKTNLKKVAYLASDTNTYYASIEKAVAAANSKVDPDKDDTETVYVIPGTTYTIMDSFEINSGVSLIFPYEGTKYNELNGEHGSTNAFATTTSRKTLVTLAAGKSITINTGGSFYISGITGSDKQAYVGNTTGSYTELTMEAGSSVVCNGGTLYLSGGYITETSSNDNEESFVEIISGYLYVPFVIYDYKGGTITLGYVNSGNISPFYIFDFVNLQVKTTIHEGSYFYGNAKISMQGNYFNPRVNIIDKDKEYGNSIFKLHDGATLTFKYTKNNEIPAPSLENLLPNDNNYTIFELTGGCEFGSFNIQISGKSVNSKNFALPFSYKFRVIAKSGSTIGINNDVKFMPGSSVVVEEGATINISKNVLFYESSFSDKQPTAGYPKGKPSATLSVGGTINVSSTGSLGASIVANSNTAILSYQSTNLVASALESNGSNPNSISAALGGKCGTETLRVNSRCFNVSKDGTGNSLLNGDQSVLSSKPIYNVVTINGTKYWKLSFSNYTVNFLSHDGTTSVHTSLTNIHTGRVTLPNATEVSNLLGWSIKKFAKEEEKTFDPGYSAYLYDIHSYFPEDKVLNLYAVLDTTKAKLSVSVSYAEEYKNKDTPKYSINYPTDNYEYSGAQTFENVFYVGDTITYKPISGIDSRYDTSFNGFDVTSNNGVYTLTITNLECAINITASGNNNSGCLVEGTLVTMSDGTKLPVEQLKEGDAVKVFDHSTGKLTTSIVARDTHNDEQAIQTDVMNLKFSDGTISRTAVDHGYFSKEENKYVYIDASNYEQYLGKEFVIFDDNGGIDYVTLDEVKITNENVRIFAPITYKHLNLIADDLLTISGGLEGIFNYFDLDENMMIDRDKMNQDIERYGLYTYEEWAEYLTPVQFDAFNVKYLKVSVGKGLVTKERLIEYIRMYL